MESKQSKVKEKKKREKDKDLSKKIEEIEKERDEYLAYAQRCKADFLNYKRDEIERLKGLIDYEKEEWALELLNVLDHFERAESETAEQDINSSVVDGFLQIQKYFKDFLEKQGIDEIETRVGKIFDPNLEEVTEAVEDKEKEEGTILEIVQKGYKHKDKVIRPTRVKVSSN
jgi:molecular chaperone GrpE